MDLVFGRGTPPVRLAVGNFVGLGIEQRVCDPVLGLDMPPELHTVVAAGRDIGWGVQGNRPFPLAAEVAALCTVRS